MKYLVTGANGFIGQHLVRMLTRQNHSVRALCRSSHIHPELSHPGTEIFSGDILNLESVKNAVTGCDGVFHLAAYAHNWARNPKTFFDVNVGGFRNILEASLDSSVKRVVFTSSALTIGPSNGTPLDGSTPRILPPFTAYEQSKCEAETLARQYDSRQLNVITVNPARVFGPGPLNEGNAVAKMIDWYLCGKWRFILGDGSAMGSYVFVEDVARGHILAMEGGRSGERYLLGGENVSLNGLFDLVRSISGCRHSLFHIPEAMVLAFAQLEEILGRTLNIYPLVTRSWVKTFMRDWECDSSKSTREIGYTVTPLRESLESSITWLRNGRASANEDFSSLGNERRLMERVTA